MGKYRNSRFRLIPERQLTFLGGQAIPIRVDLLGAHLQAYVNLLPVISTLRLCNRFGKGAKAAVSRLPAELVVCIEELLIKDERKELREDWATELKCWETRCLPTDHLSNEEARRLYIEYFWEVAEPNIDRCMPKAKLNKKQRSELDEAFLEDDQWDWNEGKGSTWRIDHDHKAHMWTCRVGGPTDDSRGFFSRHSDLIVKHFGLGTWISHTQLNKRMVGQWKNNDVYATTTAYFIVQDSEKAHTGLQRRQWEGVLEDAPAYMPTETGLCFSVCMPKQLSEKSLARFPRALKILDLKPLDKESLNHRELFASCEDMEDKDAINETHRSPRF